VVGDLGRVVLIELGGVFRAQSGPEVDGGQGPISVLREKAKDAEPYRVVESLYLSRWKSAGIVWRHS
jgi:hypothetical protein